jgi:hypothetical protein
MAKLWLVLIALLAVSNSMTFSKFISIYGLCEEDHDIVKSCAYNALVNSVDNNPCGKDFYKSNLCFTSYKQCALD